MSGGGWPCRIAWRRRDLQANLLDMLTGLLAILALGILIIVHEWGHFAVARLCNMRVDRFAIGFGPALIRRQWGETMFQIGVVPLGGYVQIAGLNPEDEAINKDDPRAYPNRPAWQRVLTIAAGPGINYAFAVLLFVVLAGFVGVNGALVDQPIAGKPAAQAGFLKGDQIVKIDGRIMLDVEQVQRTISRSKGKELAVEVLRNDVSQVLRVRPAQESDSFLIGVMLGSAPKRQRLSIGEALSYGLSAPYLLTWDQLQAFREVFRGKQKMDLRSPVYIIRVMKAQMGLGLSQGLKFVAMISTLLGFFNLLPLPALDGGRLMFLGFELVTRRPVNQRVEQIVHMVGMLLLLALLLTLVVRDVYEWVFGK